MAVSKLLDNPLAPKGPTVVDFATFDVEFKLPGVPLIIVPEFKFKATFVSFASGQPSPSESKSFLLGMPSPSVSVSVKQLVGRKNEKPCPSVLLVLKSHICLTLNPE